MMNDKFHRHLNRRRHDPQEVVHQGVVARQVRVQLDQQCLRPVAKRRPAPFESLRPRLG